MSFSQGWDTGFKALLIYIGTVFFWLIFLEDRLGESVPSVFLMNVLGGASAIGFFLWRFRAYRAERVAAAAEIEILLAEDR